MLFLEVALGLAVFIIIWAHLSQSINNIQLDLLETNLSLFRMESELNDSTKRFCRIR
jgi:hypothetical protein